MGILVIGSSNTDFSLRVKNLPRSGETVLGNAFSVQAGGKGANQAVAVARLGCDVKFCCRVGDDNNGRAALDSYRKEGIGDEYFIVDKETPSGVAMIFVDSGGENFIAVAPGANYKMTPSDIDKIGSFSDYDIVLTQLEVPLDAVAEACRRAHNDGTMMVLNPAPAQCLSPEILRNVDILTPNETEAQVLTGIEILTEEDAREACKMLCDSGVGSVVITLGGRGAYVYSGDTAELIPAYKVDPVDTTAAGDVFNGALCTALAEGNSLLSAVRFASASSALAVTMRGAQDSAPTRNSVDSFLSKTN